MRFIDLETILPDIRDHLDGLREAQDAVVAEPDPKRRARLINHYQARWTALRQAFENASYGKCWYTECRDPGADNDIDHYRPKLAVKGERSHPGYYWLAFDWRNMRLSCQRANRPRRAPGDRVASGKADHFPLLPGGVRAYELRDDIRLECPALLDPTEPSDPVLLMFKPNGEVGLSPEYKGVDAAEAKMRVSLRGLHLNWPKFLDARVVLYNQIERTVVRGEREAPTDFDGMPTAKESFKDAIRDLRRVLSPSHEYSAAARNYIETFRHVWWVRDVVLRLPA